MRSKFDPSPLKVERIQIAIDPAQKLEIFEAAARLDMTVSHFIRAACLGASRASNLPVAAALIKQTQVES